MNSGVLFVALIAAFFGVGLCSIAIADFRKSRKKNVLAMGVFSGVVGAVAVGTVAVIVVTGTWTMNALKSDPVLASYYEKPEPLQSLSVDEKAAPNIGSPYLIVKISHPTCGNTPDPTMELLKYSDGLWVTKSDMAKVKTLVIVEVFSYRCHSYTTFANGQPVGAGSATQYGYDFYYYGAQSHQLLLVERGLVGADPPASGDYTHYDGSLPDSALIATAVARLA